jgi:ABC-type transporter Mla maintaining outer membrane lipid asymmetry ATPase subunit MlaF
METIDQVAEQREEVEKDGGAPAIAVEDLHKSFGTQIVLNGISLSVRRGETLAVLGRSGTARASC